ncbi:MAG: hypothetical protein HY904_00350 [Deltaproteobacteria bacterium]|nr:hypothetical protein [Deltaproteobacteria bacterium]
MVNPGGIGGGGPIRPRVGQEGIPRQETKDTKGTKESKESKEAKGAEGKGQAGGAGGVRAKGKAKSKDLGAVGELLGGSDQYAVDNEEHEKRRRGRQFLDEDEQPFEETPWQEEDAFAVSNINAEFRAQVASGLAAGRTFTRGGVGHRAQDQVEEEGGEEVEEEEEDTPRRARKAP